MPTYYSEMYNGPEAIAVAMDIGTTQSGVSFAYFCPGRQSEGKMVTHWPGQADWNGAAKTPSIVSYRDGKVKACGAEALGDFTEHRENVAYWFKLHLHPKFGSSESEIPPLPMGLTIERVYADMMGYLMKHTQGFFEMTTPNGAEIWARLRDTIVVVLATPNGWDIREQAILRKAAISSSLVTEENAGQLLQFVTESEASVHYVLAQDPGAWLSRRTVFAIIDCGGSTVDTTVYRCVLTSPLSLNEACPSECVQAGGIFVDRKVGKMLERKLKGSSFNEPWIIKNMVDAFERELKPTFNGTMEKYSVKFGLVTDNDASLGIYKGRITLSNQELKPVFDAVINKILNSCLNTLISQKAKYVLLVGGFAESPYVRSVLSKPLSSHDIQMITVGDYTKKAAAEGAIIAHIKQFVVARAARATFGGCVRQNYDKRLHRERRHTVQVYADGKERVDGVFHVWITKGAILQGTFAHKLSYHVAWDATSTSKSELRLKLGTIEIEVFAWEGRGSDIPIWCKDEHGAVLNGMRLICTLNANLSALAGGLQIQNGPHGESFYRVDYDVYVYFGGTQLRAKLQWKEMRVLREGPVKVMPYVFPIATDPNQSLRQKSTLGAHTSIGSTSQSLLREGPVKVMPITEEKSDKTMRFENQRIPDEGGPPSEATMSKDDPPASQMTSSLSELPEIDASYSPDATMLPPPAATLQRPSRDALTSTPPSSILSRPDPISTLKHAVTSEIRASDSSPDVLHEQDQPLGPNSTLRSHASVGPATQAHSFDPHSVSVSSTQKTDAEEIVESHNPNNAISLAEGDGVSINLEKLMIDYVPCDLSGQVIIPDRGNPAQGGLADVHLGWFDKKEVAVKVLRMRKNGWAEPEWELCEASNERRIKREMHVWSALKHRNICEFLGYSMDFSDYPAMISTWCHRGTAYDYLRSRRLSVRERIRLALDVSEGLCYLHELKIVHGDLKPNNVLVDDTGAARLCDFGLVRLVDWEGPAGMTTTSPYTGTERYKAPELFASRNNRRPVATFEGDMYSLGCVMLEFIERLYPFKRFARADLQDAILDGYSPALRSETTRALLDMTDSFWDLVEPCWGDPSGRPNIKDVLDALQGFARAVPPT